MSKSVTSTSRSKPPNRIGQIFLTRSSRDDRTLTSGRMSSIRVNPFFPRGFPGCTNSPWPRGSLPVRILRKAAVGRSRNDPRGDRPGGGGIRSQSTPSTKSSRWHWQTAGDGAAWVARNLTLGTGAFKPASRIETGKGQCLRRTRMQRHRAAAPRSGARGSPRCCSPSPGPPTPGRRYWKGTRSG